MIFPYFHSSTPLTAGEHGGIVVKVKTEREIEAHSSDESFDGHVMVTTGDPEEPRVSAL